MLELLLEIWVHLEEQLLHQRQQQLPLDGDEQAANSGAMAGVRQVQRQVPVGLAAQEVWQQQRVVAFAQLDESCDRRNIAVHAEDGVGNDELATRARRAEARAQLAERYDLRGLVYESDALHTVASMAAQVAHADVPVLYLPENPAINTLYVH